ncbi:hypothetical protein DCC39_13485 [Pueribacillus theae]|uniref:Uncharacterized protein n=1 Tax=Pueribacillus theae TaxID=2171751 RepID=A0A2U1JVU5_9BACI|nr:hypothetical protein DCC39_13485 [Pueribacillus theae]
MKENFITFEEGNKSYVVLTIYKDQFLYTPIDREAKKIEKTFNLIDIKSVESFSNESIGSIGFRKTSHN